MEFVPHVTRADVLRIVRRDFAAHDANQVLAILDQYGAKSWHPEKDRVQLAVLKLSSGSVEYLRQNVKLARRDYRDVISAAEYPRFFPVGVAELDRLSPPEIEQLQELDWQQYKSWLEAARPSTDPPQTAMLQAIKRRRDVSGCAGLLLGPLVGMLMALPAAANGGRISLPLGLAVGAGLGLVAGAILWVFDQTRG